MVTIRWSWIFILYSLLVRPGSAMRTDSHIVNDILPRVRGTEPRSFMDRDVYSTTVSSRRKDIGGVIGVAVGGTVVIIFVLVWFLAFRKRKSSSHVEDGVGGKERSGWLPDLKSEFSPDEKSRLRFDRIRDAFARRGAKKNAPPAFQVSMPPGFTDIIDRPAPAVPSYVPRYPSMLERGYNKRPHHPPSQLRAPRGAPRIPSITNSWDSSQDGNRASRRKVQIPPRALLVPPSGRPLPGFSDRRPGGLRTPKSPSRRRSWLQKRPVRHPFIPIRDSDHFLHFTPGQPLLYHPSRQHLEARLESRSASEKPHRQPVKRQPVPLYEEGGASKQARLVEALQSSGNQPLPIMTSGKVPIPDHPSSTYI